MEGIVMVDTIVVDGNRAEDSARVTVNDLLKEYSGTLKIISTINYF